MPMFEFNCSACKRSFEELIFSQHDEQSVVCPSCASKEISRKLSAFAVGGGASVSGLGDVGSYGGGGSSCAGGCCGGSCG